MDPKLKTM